MNHKRKKRKNIRAGCLACKPHKVNGNNERAKVKEETVALIREQPVIGCDPLEHQIYSNCPNCWDDNVAKD